MYDNIVPLGPSNYRVMTRGIKKLACTAVYSVHVRAKLFGKLFGRTNVGFKNSARAGCKLQYKPIF